MSPPRHASHRAQSEKPEHDLTLWICGTVRELLGAGAAPACLACLGKVCRDLKAGQAQHLPAACWASLVAWRNLAGCFREGRLNRQGAQVRLLEHKQNKKIRLLMRQEKTLKIRANHIGALLNSGHAPNRLGASFLSWLSSHGTAYVKTLCRSTQPPWQSAAHSNSTLGGTERGVTETPHACTRNQIVVIPQSSKTWAAGGIGGW